MEMERLTVVKEQDKNSFSVLNDIQIQKGARTIAVNKITHHLYLPTAEKFQQVPKTDEGNHKVRPKILPNSFVVLDIEP